MSATQRATWVVLLLAVVTAGCSTDPREAYCDAVSEHQESLGEILGQGGPAALLRALPIFRDLQEQAPDDIADDWQVLVDALGDLEQAVEEAGADPATYDREAPPAGVTAQEQSRIDAAAAEVGGEGTRAALAAVEQQARDVCHTPLAL
ncbi:MAG TPA: hypothetical protein VGE38_04760 [Nocardioides sp.]|uniref:hypothetical protein n=1 Tax=Nocardioides sp. TaxID=35761 RepID=UPI002EDB3417